MNAALQRAISHLKGKKLAVDAVDTAFALTLRRILLARGLDLKRGDYKLGECRRSGAATGVDEEGRDLCRDPEPAN